MVSYSHDKTAIFIFLLSIKFKIIIIPPLYYNNTLNFYLIFNSVILIYLL